MTGRRSIPMRELQDGRHQVYEHLLQNVVLPRVLTKKILEDRNEQELILVKMMAGAVRNGHEWIPDKIVQNFNRFELIQHDRTPETVSDEIAALEPGDTFAILLREQKTVFMIHMPANDKRSGKNSDPLVSSSDGSNSEDSSSESSISDANDNESHPNAKSKTVTIATFASGIEPKNIYTDYLEYDCLNARMIFPSRALDVEYSELIRSKDFAHQLCCLYKVPTPAKKHYQSNHCNGWLTMILSQDRMEENHHFPTITKKVRDEAIDVDGTNQNFQRLDVYMAMKVLLQHSLTMEMNATDGLFVYKICMLRFITKLCAKFEDSSICSKLNVDLMSETLAKIARRIEKLFVMKHDGNFPNNIEQFCDEVVDSAKATITKMRGRIDKQINQLQGKYAKKAELKPLKDLNFDRDTNQKVPTLRKYLAERKSVARANRNIDMTSHYSGGYQLLARRQLTEPTFEHWKKSKAPMGNVFLADNENWFLYQMNLVDCKKLKKWHDEYVKRAEKVHLDDPIGISRMMLVRLKLLESIDRIATQAYPLLLDHRIIDTSIFDILLLPHSIDMKIAHDLCTYFDERNQNARLPGLIEEREITSNSFSVRFASANDEMQHVLEQINNDFEEEINGKQIAWEACRKKSQELRQTMSNLNCALGAVVDPNALEQHRLECEKCKINHQIECLMITQYQHPLPESPDSQNAIVFELHCPIEIGLLRDMLHATVKFEQNPSAKMQTKDDWKTRYTLDKYNQSNPGNVNLTSDILTPSISHHIDEYDNFDQWIVPNRLNCVFHEEHMEIFSTFKIDAIKTKCTLSVEPQSAYANLQWTLNTTTHTQNQVLARQAECCPQNLSLSEFIEFGSLRADGHRLQLRKLYAMITTETLSFDEPSVLSLILQTIWETGVAGNDGCARESHADFIDPNFTNAMIDSLDKFIEQQKDSWARPTKLLVAVLITMRIFELTDFVPDKHSIEYEVIVNKLVVLIDRIRATVIDWLKRIQDILHRGRIHSQDDEKSLRWSMALVSITAAMTFLVNSNHSLFKKILTTNATNQYTAPRTWLQAIVTLNNNMLLSDDSQTKSKLNLKMLSKLVRNIGIQIESSIHLIIQNDPADIYELIKQQWPLAATGEFLGLTFSSISKQTIIVDVQFNNDTKQVSIDMITGLFLVGSLPIDRLPHKIITNPLYQRIFGDYSFEVQPDDQKFSTVHDFNRRIYEFGWRNGKDLIIKELRQRDNDNNNNQLVEFELIPHTIFENEIPEILIEKHSHWWKKQDDIIEFRPTTFTDEQFLSIDGTKYELNLNTNHLTQIKTGRRMLSIHSASYDKIKMHLARLEQPKNILVFMDSSKVAKIELLRMNLKFRIDISKAKDDGSVDMLSNEFSRVRVSLQQNCGTLYGLKYGLLLESIPDMNGRPASKLMIVPHAQVQGKRSPSHISAGMDLDGELRTPSYHRYEMNETMQTLEPSNGSYSAWFYLAYLHAITSHSEPEPLTGMSGTERALQILQSKFVWSSAPYDTETIQTLQMIADLSPNRHLVNHYIQKIEWPNKIHRHSAQDSFFSIVYQLIEDSQRLGELYLHNEKVELKKMKHLNLNRRDYLRCLPLKPNVRVQDIFIEHPVLQTRTLKSGPVPPSKNIRTVASLYHKNSFMTPKDFDLMGYLTKDGECLDGSIHMDKISNYINHVDIHITFKNMWISLYEEARNQRFNDDQFVILWSLIAYDGGKTEPLLILQAVAKNPDSFHNIEPPDIREFFQPDKQHNAAEIVKILAKHYAEPLDRNRSGGRQTSDDIEVLTDYVQSKWPCNEVDLRSYRSTIAHRFHNFYKAGHELNEHLRICNDNRKLKLFIDKIQGKLGKLKSGKVQISRIQQRANVDDIENTERFIIDFEKKICHQMDHCIEKADAINAWQSEHNSDHRTADDWWSIIKNTINADDDNKHLIDAGMYPGMVPHLLLPKIASKEPDSNPNQIAIIGALATAIARGQRNRRNVADGKPSERQSLSRKLQLNRRTESEPHVNWKPCEYPEWLLFEIEQNLTIRPIQIDIAKRMIDPPVQNDIKHSVMQLNMGEGKTAVIVPILAAFLADGNQQCQIIVLKSLFTTNLNALRQYLGGMLNRRIYIFPCRRDMPMAESVSKMLHIYEECKSIKGVILTLPEYLLSFQLKMYESVQKGNPQAARSFLVVHKWMNENVRNVLDESDAILNPKYQLIYTIGNQRSLDGGSKRWTVAQAILKRVPHHMRKLYDQQQCCDDEHVEAKIEYDKDYLVNAKIYGESELNYRPDIFTPCRILDEDVFDELAKNLIDDFINADLDLTFPAMNATDQTMVRHFLSKKCSAELTDKVKSRFSSVNFETLLILSGLLSCGILKLILMRRWRVNYGVNKETGVRKMAIPFKAKDVPAEMTDFGHPDVAICFTQLSYYYSGLTDEQLFEVFDVLKADTNAGKFHYEKWIGTIPTRLRDPSIETYSGINLEDPTQRNDRLFPMLRYNMNVIDFWLSTKVYKREAKTFEKKLICTAWDLSSESLKHRLTGFSGTNDTQNILPLPVAQNDLQCLQQTNEKLLETLLRPENEKYYALPANVSANYILQKLVYDVIPALFDAGALMLELSNEQMAREWLKIAKSTFDAAIFFDSNDVLQTIDRNGVIVELDSSVYRDNLSRCLVYVDDAHIRGTDLKFPDKWRGCVTLSGDITRDKTVQACMRMRKLGYGHSISFWASHEADARIKKVCDLSSDDQPTNEHVIEFIRENSKRYERDNMPYWVSAAHNYTKKLAGHMLYENEYGKNAIVNLSNKCIDDEFVTLKDMYENRQDVQLQTISAEKFQELIKVYEEDDSVVKFIEKIDKDVRQKLAQQESNYSSHRGLDEEQEKEIEQEFEMQEQIERPQPVRPACANFNNVLHNLFLNGLATDLRKLKMNKAIVPIPRSLAKTHLYQTYINENDAWSTNLHVTKDFIQVLSDRSRSYDDFLRPVWWIAGVQIDEFPTQWLLLSSFECDRLYPTFQKSKNATLLMYRPRTSKTHDNLLHDCRLQVTAMENPLAIDLRSEVEIGVYAGSMFFQTEAEQQAFCGFLGLVPQPRTPALEFAFQVGIIEPNGFVLTKNRKWSNTVADCVGDCHFVRNPCGLVSGLIGAHQQLMRRESHVASIVDRGVKLVIEVIQEDPDVIMIDDNSPSNNRERRKRMSSNLESDVEQPHYWKKPKLEPDT